MVWKTDESIARLAADQHGIVTRAQLLERGITPHGVSARVRNGRFGLLHRGVYAVGPFRSPRAKEMAAVLACGEGAVVSHTSADTVWQPEQPGNPPAPGQAEQPTRRGRPGQARAGNAAKAGRLGRGRNGELPVDVTIDRGDRRHRPGIRIHRVASLEPADVTTRDGIPVATPLRTLLDLATVVGRRELEQAIGRAERNGLVDHEQLRAMVDSRPGRPGSRVAEPARCRRASRPHALRGGESAPHAVARGAASGTGSERVDRRVRGGFPLAA